LFLLPFAFSYAKYFLLKKRALMGVPADYELMTSMIMPAG
jgi:hypothetical protein